MSALAEDLWQGAGGPTQLPGEPTIFVTTPGYCIAGWSNVLINCVSETVNPGLLDEALKAHMAVHRQHQSGIGVFTTMTELPGLPSAEARKQAADAIKSTSGQVLAQVTCIPLEGFTGSAARSVIAAINLLARAPNPTKVAATDEAGAEWLGQFMSIGDEPVWVEGLASAIRHVKTHWQNSL